MRQTILAVGSMQDLAGVDNPGFLSNLFTDARDTVGTSNINDYDYTINLGGGLSDDGKTGLTPSEAATRMAFAQYDWADKIKQIEAKEAAQQAAAQQAAIRNSYDSYQSNLGGGSNWNSSLTSGPDISYSSARDKSSTTGYNFNMD